MEECERARAQLLSEDEPTTVQSLAKAAEMSIKLSNDARLVRKLSLAVARMTPSWAVAEKHLAASETDDQFESWVSWDSKSDAPIGYRLNWSGASDGLFEPEEDQGDAIDTKAPVMAAARALGIKLTDTGTKYVQLNLSFYNDSVELERSMSAQIKRIREAQNKIEATPAWQGLPPEKQATIRDKTQLRVEHVRNTILQEHDASNLFVAGTLVTLLALAEFTEYVYLPDDREHWLYAMKLSDVTSIQHKVAGSLLTAERTLTDAAHMIRASWTSILADKADVAQRLAQVAAQQAAQAHQKGKSGEVQQAPQSTLFSPATVSDQLSAPTLHVAQKRSAAPARVDEDVTFQGVAFVKVPKARRAPKEQQAEAVDSKNVLNMLLQLGVAHAKGWAEQQASADDEVVLGFVRQDVMALLSTIAFSPKRGAGYKAQKNSTSERVLEAIERSEPREKAALVEKCKALIQEYVAGETDTVTDPRTGAFPAMEGVLSDLNLSRHVKVQFGNHFVEAFFARHNFRELDDAALKESKAAARRLRDDESFAQMEAMDAEVRAQVRKLKKSGFADWRGLISDLVMEDKEGDADVRYDASDDVVAVNYDDDDDVLPEMDFGYADDDDADRLASDD